MSTTYSILYKSGRHCAKIKKMKRGICPFSVKPLSSIKYTQFRRGKKMVVTFIYTLRKSDIYIFKNIVVCVKAFSHCLNIETKCGLNPIANCFLFILAS